MGSSPIICTCHASAWVQKVLADIRRIIQWNPSKVDTIRTKHFVRYSKVSLAQGLVVDHAPPTIAASYDKALLWTMKKTVLMRDLSIDSS